MKHTPYDRMQRAVRPARAVTPAKSSPLGADTRADVLIVDLNNFASFPTLAIGILTAALRNHGHRVRLMSPLAYDRPATMRERRETIVDHALRRVRLSDMTTVVRLRGLLRERRLTVEERPDEASIAQVVRELDARPTVVLLSAYLQHREAVRRIAAAAGARGVPVLLGGPMFGLAEVAEAWRGTPGLTAVVGAEADRDVPGMVEAVRNGGDLLAFPGVVLPDGRRSAPARPLRELDQTPVPDFTDFPWDRYPVRIVPVMTGRGCQWDKCLFCSDVISTSGRTFRTRSVASVLSEMEEQARRHGTASFLFLDLKLNSWPGMIRGIARELGRRVEGAEWIGTVHVDRREDNGLSARDLALAAEGGMRRVSFGLESGSQRMLDAMHKGSCVERNARFIRDAYAAGLSIRCTMFKGFPGETADDMERTADFLEEHAPFLDRVRFNNFTIYPGTPIHEATARHADASDLVLTRPDSARGRVDYARRAPLDRAYRRAKRRALAVVHAINARPLRDAARQFDGLM
ncbi:radical SAM protein [Jannaschia sp. W003]|uniref:B12-binding domain-containing radical SAM protein n=1 Tax=Jannaschia sp. W003 TaxID=2867012 RepID=UPI0021A36DD4|nr:radical SAM protein [Jannaschia sp. W003]UWQ23122.1 radical SAM protein [Jannaschia sp. W003]